MGSPMPEIHQREAHRLPFIQDGRGRSYLANVGPGHNYFESLKLVRSSIP